MAELLHRPDTVHIHMPVYNGEQYVGAAIDAVLVDMETSGIDDFRLFIGDDASTDTTPEILETYSQHPSITVVTHANNLGVGGNRALLLETTLQEAVLPRAISVREQDDISIPGTSATLLDAMDRQNAQLVGGAMLEFFGTNTNEARLLERPNGQETIERNLLRAHVPVWNPTMMFDPSKVRELGITYPTPRYCDDLLFMGRLVFGGATTHNTNEPTVYYRKHPDSITTGWNPQNAIWYWRAMQQIWAESPLKPTPADKAYVASRAILYLGLSSQSAAYQMTRRMYHGLKQVLGDQPEAITT